MSAGEMLSAAWRRERDESNRLVWALVISLIFHLCLVGTYQTGKYFHWWENFRWPAWMQTNKMLTELLRKKNDSAKPNPQEEIPLMFLEVSPAQASTEVPENAKFYSDKNSLAANPEANKETDTPKIS